VRVALSQDAAIVNDYLTGRCGLKATSVFSQAGVGWPLETIVGVAAFEDAERERNQGTTARVDSIDIVCASVSK
jgi:hypothetical protein